MNIYDALHYGLKAIEDRIDNLHAEEKAWNENHDIEIEDNQKAFKALEEYQKQFIPLVRPNEQ